VDAKTPKGVGLMARRMGKPSRVADVLPGYLDRAGIAERVAQAGVLDAWPALVGPQIARVASAETVTADGTLFVRVASAAWRQELSLMTPDIIARINAGRKQGRVARIRWVNGGG
jgi:predicted nucleic acid-binding Zn ribbon protein